MNHLISLLYPLSQYFSVFIASYRVDYCSGSLEQMLLNLIFPLASLFSFAKLQSEMVEFIASYLEM